MWPIRYIIIVLLATIVPATMKAQGFPTKDLTGIEAALKSVLGTNFDSRAEPRRLTFACSSCSGAPMLDIQLSRQTDGTEQRLRSGETQITDLERICQQQTPQCRLSMLDVGPAVGWVSSYPIGDTQGATAVIIRQGDMLTIRSLAKDAATARRSINKVLPVILDRVIAK